jgi:hydroxymethylpyrimidine pyrophosphatase-like HAD family hydrolase
MPSAIRAVIFDLDGTAVPSRIDGLPSPALCRAIRAAPSFVRFCAATGRSWQHAKGPVGVLQLKDPCVISGGTQIIDPLSEEILWQLPLPKQAVTLVKDVAVTFQKRLAYVNELTVTEPLPGAVHPPKGLINTIYMFEIQPEELAAVLARLRAIEELHAAPTQSWLTPDVTDLHITHSQATKEQAVVQLLRLLELPKARVAGVGDGHNDLHLFAAVGHKIAMGNAVPELKRQADLVIEPITRNGLARYIEQLEG